MKLWGGRFTKEENQLVHNFNESISFDQKFYRQDIAGSIAHVTMLAKQRNPRISIPSLRRTLSNGSEMPERDSTPGEAEMIRSLSI